MTGTLSINGNYSYGYVNIFQDTEGGTIQISGPNQSTVFEIDAWSDNSIRIHNAVKRPDNAPFRSIQWNSVSGEFSGLVDPTLGDGAATKNYVDSSLNRYLPLTGGELSSHIWTPGITFRGTGTNNWSLQTDQSSYDALVIFSYAMNPSRYIRINPYNGLISGPGCHFDNILLRNNIGYGQSLPNPIDKGQIHFLKA